MADEREFQVGDRVRHPEFGQGLILETRGSGDVASVLVSFEDRMRRKLMVRFAKLTLLAPATPPPTPPGKPPRHA